MDMPRNRFKAALKAGQHQLGVWNSIGGNTVPEMLAIAGFDWVLLDTEHSPVEPVEILPALQAVAGYPQTSAVVRPVVNDTALIKRYLDMGAQTLLIPYVQTAEEAEAAVAAMRYPPAGVRGLSGLSRATRFGRVANYHRHASDELCLLVQVETQEAVDNLDSIAAVDGVDGVFIGPSDLSASMGHTGNSGHPEVAAAIETIIARLKEKGMPAGILTLDRKFAHRCIDLGTSFTAVGVDLGLLMTATMDLHDEFRR